MNQIPPNKICELICLVLLCLIGPNWKSLCQPAILPVTIDHYTDPKDLGDYQFSHHKVILDAQRTNYNSHSDLLKEMVKQRLIQDFQLVPESILHQRKTREVDRTDPFVKHRSPTLHNRNTSMEHMPKRHTKIPLTKHSNTIEYTLSMGHRTQVLSYNSMSDEIKVVQYNAKFAQNTRIYRYDYMLLSSSSISR